MKRQFKTQKGVVTLAVSIILLLVATFLVLAVAKSVVSDQKSLGDELRSKELYQAATGALEYGLRQLKIGDDALNAWSGDAVGDTTTPLVDPNDAATTVDTMSTGNTYDLTVTYTRLTNAITAVDPVTGAPDPNGRQKPIFRVSATATPVNGGDTHISKTVETIALRSDLFGSTLGGAGPILVEGNMTDSKATVEIVPGPNGVAVGSLGGPGANVDVDDPGSPVETHGGVVVTSADNTTSLSEALFGIDDPAVLDSVMRSLAAQNDHVIYLDGDYDKGNLPASFDSPTDLETLDLTDPANQYLVYFSSTAGCPKLNGNPNIVGLVYISTPSCDDNGWGGCNIYGTVAFEGDINDMNSNCQFIGLDMSGWTPGVGGGLAELSPVPGTWKDWQ
jgi:hypothetical protein